MSNRLFSTFPKWVDDELQSRREKVNSSRPRKIQKPKSPWMRMVAGFKPKNGERKVLMGGDLDVNQSLKFGFKNLYETKASTGEKYRPKPTIESITVEEQLNSFNCTVNWKVFSIGQLERLFTPFMGIGNTVLIDWGWDDVDPSAIIDASDVDELKKFFQTADSGKATKGDSESSNPKVSPRTLNIHDTPKWDQLKKAKGRYSFVAGSIGSFSYSPDENNTYSCTTEIQSVSKVTSNIRVLNQENPRNENAKDEQQKGFRPSLDEFVKQKLQSYMKRKSKESNKDVVQFNKSAEFNRREDAENVATYYLSWKEIETIINEYATYTKGGKSAKGTSNAEIRSFELDSGGSIISSYSAGDNTNRPAGDPLQLRTLDSLVCIVDVDGASDVFRKFNDTSVSENVQGKVNDKREGLLYNLYVEYQVFKDAILKNDKVLKALDQILGMCSAACFNIWDFKKVGVDNRIQWIDKNASENKVSSLLGDDQESSEFKFRPNTKNSICRSFSFDANVEDTIKSAIALQVHTNLRKDKENAAMNTRQDAPGQFFKIDNEGKDVITETNLQKPAETTDQSQSKGGTGGRISPPEQTITKQESGLDIFSGGGLDYEGLRKKANQRFAELEAEGTQRLVYRNRGANGSAKAFAQLMEADPNQNSPVNSNITLPITPKISLDGIGGLTAHQVFRIENIPKAFTKEGVFMIDSVSHSVSVDDWTTEIEGTYVVQNQTESEG